MDPLSLIELLGLKPLPHEGGYYRETYRSNQKISAEILFDHIGHDKDLSAAIYYLLTPDTFSALHRLPCDEIFHFYLGDAVTMLELHPDGHGETITLGHDITEGHRPQHLVPRGVWQGTFLNDGGTLALMGTTTSPAFDFDDLQLAGRDDLLKEYPEYASLIHHLTR